MEIIPKSKEIIKTIETLIKPFSKENLILAGYRGSYAHGTYIPGFIDDLDIWGIIVPPIEYFWGLDKYEHTDRQIGNIDFVAYSIIKYFNLLLKNNPNVLSFLYLNNDRYIRRTKLGQMLIDNRDIFVSKKCYKSFVGYAYGQLKRMTHYKFEGYMGKKRKALVDEFGYDCKNAAHLIRLLKMGIELLTLGKMYVFRKDAQLYMDIKKGEWSLEKVKKEADRLFSLIEEALIKSELPSKPDYKKANQLCVELIGKFHQSHIKQGENK